MKKSLKLIVFILMQCVFMGFATAQIAKGVVIDEKGETIIGASVREKDTKTGTITDIDGKFTLNVKSLQSTLVISYVGCTTQEVKASSQLMKVVMKANIKDLDEVVVVGYGVQKRTSITGSVSSIAGEKLQKLPTDNITNMLGGRVAGLVTRQTSGVPGENGSSISIRGGKNPLVLVDGVPRDFANLDPSEIESFTVLKDAASASIYGVNGGDGVILVTTKRGNSNKLIATYNGLVSASTNTNFPTFLNGLEYAEYHNKAKTLDGQAIEFDEQRIGYIKNGNDPMGVWGNTDWFKLIFKPYAPSTSHSLNLTGGSDRVKFSVNANYLKQDGIISNVNFDRFNLRSNLDIKISNSLTFKADISGRLENRHQPGVTAGSSDPSGSTENGGATMGYKNIVFYTISATPVVNPRMPDGTYIGYNNPLIARDESGFTDKKQRLVQTSMSLIYDASKWMKGLKITGLFAYDFTNSFYKQFLLPCDEITPQYGTGLGVGSTLQWTPGLSPHLLEGNRLTDAMSNYTTYTFQAIANYNRKFGNHDFGVDMVWEQSGNYSNSFGATKQNFPLTEIADLSFSSTVAPNSVYGGRTQNGRAGFIARVNYAYLNKYLLQFSGRADWSSRFLGDKRLGLFPSVSLGWRLSEESFIKDNTSLSFVNNLKIRGSYGVLGRDNISANQYVRNFDLTQTNNVIFGDNGSQSLRTSNVANPTLTWETISTYNLGFESVLWNGLLSFEMDAFYRVNADILQSTPNIYPPSLGGNFPSYVNSGVIDTKGIEITVGHKKSVNKDFNYSLNGTFTFAQNRHVKIDDSPNIPVYQRRTGQVPYGVLGYISEGLYQDENDLRYSPKTSEEVRIGDIKYKDINGDGIISTSDRVWIAKNPVPQIIYGLNMDCQYKLFDISLFFQGAAMSDIMLSGTYNALGYSDATYFTQIFKWGSNPPKYLAEGSWTPDNTDAEYPRLSTKSSSNNAAISDFWKRDASYIRLKNAQIGFNVPKRTAQLLKLETARLFLSGTNLLTFSKLKFIDPEAPSVNNGYYPQQRVFSLGLNVTF